MNAARLQMNLRANGYGVDNCVLAAASDVNALGWLYVPITFGYCTGASRLDRFKTGQKFAANIRRLDYLISVDLHARVGVIKLDVEYHLLRALKGAGGLLAAYAPDLIFESFEPGVDEYLLPFGYSFWHINEGRGLSKVERISAMNPDASRNYFASVRQAPAEWMA